MDHADPTLCRALVVGGGMAGLATALALGRTLPRGQVPLVLLEQSEAFSEVGAGLQLGSLANNKLLATSLLTIKHLLTPLLALLLVRLLQLNPVQTATFLCFSALPTASTAYVLASRMGYNGPFVAALVTLSTLLAALSIPFALGVLQPWAAP